MKQEYFIYNGNSYPSGTVVYLQIVSVQARCVYNEKATFLYYDTDVEEYVFEIWGQKRTYSKEFAERNIKGIYDSNKTTSLDSKQHPNECTFSDELNIDGLFIAWIWYIFIMVIATLFYDRIAIWIFASIMFFLYRNRKLKEAGYK